MANGLDDREHVCPASRSEWRRWLKANHLRSSGIWLVYWKRSSGQPTDTYDEAVEEALCFGWIDSKVNPLDDQRYRQLLTPRKPGSPWSALNKRRVEKLLASKKITAAGLATIDAAKRDGSWTVLDAAEALIVPTDLQQALERHPGALQNFEAFNPSSKKNILWWIQSAKRPQTRQQRIDDTVEKAAHNVKAKP